MTKFQLKILFLFIAMFSVSTMSSCLAAQKQYLHKDEGEADLSFAVFRKTMLESIEKRDKTSLEQMLSAHIATGIGSAQGIENFENKWQDLDADSPFWRMAQKVLKHGAQLDRESGEFHAPAVSFDDNHSDFPLGLVWLGHAKIYSAPDSSNELPTGPLNAPLTLLAPREHKPLLVKWVKVKTSRGTVGFIRSDEICSSFDNFAVFKKEDGNWRMTWFGYPEL